MVRLALFILIVTCKRHLIPQPGRIFSQRTNSKRDTWKPKVFGGAPTQQAAINHGTYFYWAHEEGLLANDTNIHAGIRTTLSGLSDYDNDGYCGFQIIEAREIDYKSNDTFVGGTEGIIQRIRDRVGKWQMYLSLNCLS